MPQECRHPRRHKAQLAEQALPLVEGGVLAGGVGAQEVRDAWTALAVAQELVFHAEGIERFGITALLLENPSIEAVASNELDLLADAGSSGLVIGGSNCLRR